MTAVRKVNEGRVERRTLVRARVGNSVVFFLAGYVYASFAARLPEIKHSLSLTDGQLAIAFIGLNAGAILGLQFGGAMMSRWGSRLPLRSSLPGFGLALLGPAVASSLVELTIALFILACLNSVVDVGMNAQGVVLEARLQRRIMSQLHGLQPLGLIAGSALGALAAHHDVSLVRHLSAAAVTAAFAALVASSFLLPAELETGRDRHKTKTLHELVDGWSRPIIILGALAFCCTLADGAALEWTSVYLSDALGVSRAAAALGFTVFASALALGRLAGDRLTARFGPVTVFRLGALGAGAGFGGALLVDMPVAGFAGVALLGLGLANALPLAISSGGNLPHQPAALAAARISTLAYLGSFTGPALIGFLADRAGLPLALGLPAALVTITAAGATAVARAGAATTSPGH
jgi:fucose permease